MTRPLLLLLAMIPLTTACGDDDGVSIDAAPLADAPPVSDAGPITSRGELGVIEGRGYYDDGISGLVEQPYGRVEARFFAGHEANWHQVVMNDGTCKLLAYTPAFCSQFCDGVCTAPEVCEPWPTYVSVGAIVVSGMKVPATLTPDAYNYYYFPGGMVTPTELFDAADTIGMSANGADIPAFMAQATGVAKLETPITQTGKITLTPGQDHIIAWTPAGGAGADVRVRVTLNSNNQGHGAPYMKIISCDAPDAAGQVTIPAAMVDAFPETMAWSVCAGSDCPPSWIRRYTRSTTTVPDGDVGLVVGSQVDFGVDHMP